MFYSNDQFLYLIHFLSKNHSHFKITADLKNKLEEMKKNPKFSGDQIRELLKKDYDSIRTDKRRKEKQIEETMEKFKKMKDSNPFNAKNLQHMDPKKRSTEGIRRLQELEKRKANSFPNFKHRECGRGFLFCPKEDKCIEITEFEKANGIKDFNEIKMRCALEGMIPPDENSPRFRGNEEETIARKNLRNAKRKEKMAETQLTLMMNKKEDMMKDLKDHSNLAEIINKVEKVLDQKMSQYKIAKETFLKLKQDFIEKYGEKDIPQ